MARIWTAATVVELQTNDVDVDDNSCFEMYLAPIQSCAKALNNPPAAASDGRRRRRRQQQQQQQQRRRYFYTAMPFRAASEWPVDTTTSRSISHRLSAHFWWNIKFHCGNKLTNPYVPSFLPSLFYATLKVEDEELFLYTCWCWQ